MPTEREYLAVFGGISDAILSRSANTKAEVRHLVALANQAVRAERDKRIRDISNRWKEQFAIIKRENDEWQKALSDAYHGELQMISEREGDMMEGLQR